MRVSPLLCFALFCLLAPRTAPAEDWPQWLGLQRDGVYREAGVVSAIPDGGLPVKWTADIAYGYAGPAVASRRVYLFDFVLESGEIVNLPSRRNKVSGQERLTCYDVVTGKPLWREAYPTAYNISYEGGPRCTPTVDDDRVYTLGAEGDLVCRRTADGSLVWRKSFRNEYEAKTPFWGHSAHPLVVGDTLFCLVGGEGSLAVAFDKRTGEEQWRNLSSENQGYCPPTMIEHNGAEQLLIWGHKTLHSVRPATGEPIWSLPTTNVAYGMSIAAPQKLGDKLFISAIGNVSVLMQLRPDGSDVDVLWAGNAKQGVRSVNTTPLLEDGVIYGVDCETSELMAVDMRDGRRLWATQTPVFNTGRGRHGTAFLVKHQPEGVDSEGRYFLFNELGDLITARLTREGYQETGRMHVLEPTGVTFGGRPVVWSHPAFAERAMFARNDKQLVCIDLAE